VSSTESAFIGCDKEALERQSLQMESIGALTSCRGVIFSENRIPLFRIMPSRAVATGKEALQSDSGPVNRDANSATV
jgi:hypothetical protein